MTTQLIDKPTGVSSETRAQSGSRKITISEGIAASSCQHADFGGLMDPLIMVDHFVMTQPTVGTHAHAGLSAVTVIFDDNEGAFHNCDSVGNALDLAAGDLCWFKAARGSAHNKAPRPAIPYVKPLASGAHTSWATRQSLTQSKPPIATTGLDQLTKIPNPKRRIR